MLLAGAWALLLAQFWAVGRLVVALVWNPLSYRYLEHYLAQRIVLRPHPLAGDSEVGTQLRSLELLPVVTLRSTSDDAEPSLDVYQSENRFVTALAGRGVIFATKLQDGRLVVSTDLAIPPGQRLLVNLQPGQSTAELRDGHMRLIHSLIRRGLKPVPTGPEIAVDVLKAEQNAYDVLGPVLGSFLAIEDSPNKMRLQVGVEPVSA